MPIDLVYDGPDGAVAELRVTVGALARVGDLRQALEAHLRTAGQLYSGLTPLADPTPVADTDLVDGAAIGLGSPVWPVRTVDAPLADFGELELAVAGGLYGGPATPVVACEQLSVGRHGGADLVLADPEASRAHAQVSMTDTGAVLLTDMGARNGIRVRGHRLGHTAELATGDVFGAGETVLGLRERVVADADLARAGGSLWFTRSPRRLRPRPPNGLAVPVAPERPAGFRFPLLAVLAPVLPGLLLVAPAPVLAGLLLALTPLLALANLVSDRHTGRREYLVEHKDYLARLAHFRAALAETAVAEERQARIAHPDPGTIVSLACHPSARLWERRHGDADFLTVRVGLADRPAEFALWPETTCFGVAYPEPPVPPTVYDVPVTVALPEIRVLGVVCAARDTMLAAARALVAQVATLHAPDDLSIVVATAPDAAPDWAWTGWLPHTVTTPRPGTVTLVMADGVPTDVTAPGDERYAVHFATDEQELPRDCGAVIVADGTRATVRGAGRPAVADVLLDGLIPAAATRVARALAPVRLAGEDPGAAAVHDTVPAIAARSVEVGPRSPATVPEVRSASSANHGIPPLGGIPAGNEMSGSRP
jgi:S-DNA-T family DNA segregation ATPase FtsK/SpoIIIE